MTRLQQAQALAAAAWLLRRVAQRGRPRPVTLEARLANIPTRGLPVQAPVRISWDEHAIPSIEAGGDRDLAVALGMVHAHLRLAQMEAMRRLATGRVSEIVGPAGIEVDRALRLMRFGAALPAMLAALPDDTRRWAEGFVAGVNHLILQAPALPYEFGLLGIQPEPWTVEQLLLVGRLAAADVSWIVFARLLRGRAGLSEGEWDLLWPLLQQGDAPPAPRGTAEAAAGLARGSNSVGVGASLGMGGAGLIASDPHLGIPLPPLWLVAGLHAPGLDAVGLMVPGLPVLALGRTDALAWGGTSLHAASSELVDVSDESMTVREEVVRVRGHPPVTLRLRETRFGPVVSDGILMPSDRPVALRWVGHAPSDEMTAMLGAMRARSLEGFRTALAGFAVPGQTMVAVEAGPAGRAGRVVAAHLPRRPLLPMAGLVAGPAEVWGLNDLARGTDFPAVAERIAASANDRPDGTPVPVGFFFSLPDRARRLRALLDAAAPVTAETMRAVQLDVRQEGALALRDVLAAQLPALAGPRQAEAVRAMQGWDGGYDKGSRGALVFEVLVGELARRLVPARSLGVLSTIWTGRALIAQRIADAPPALLRPTLRLALRAAARALRRSRTWGGAHRLRLQHPLGALPGVGRWFALPEVPAAGGNDTVNKTGHDLLTGRRGGRHRVTFGACARHLSDMGDPDGNWFVLLGGQDGWLGSENMADQVALWMRGEAIQVPLRPEVARAWPHRTELLP